ncbi:MAG: putative Transposon Ty3-I Gag-Pol polyprotein [Streblomastix strix]|uniref:Putative Transposon Ty3-I Gag-Pol polyprotein n=1 Tax=Streblomastix strix TaxID=222440 RepID=A0A5J4ULG8_9EUKA|nr:MAG: putative Transposon Ty3-I Gag-Pol polyprotein [Streblomastix strix]
MHEYANQLKIDHQNELTQLRIQVDLLALGHHEEIDTITDITTINVTTEMTNYEKKWSKQQECTGLPSLTRTRWNLESLGGGQQNRTGGDTRICGPLRSQRKYNQTKCHTHMPTAQGQFHLQKERVQGRFGLHIQPKDKAGIKHRATIDQPQLKPHPHTRTLRTTEGATTIEIEDTGNRSTIYAHRIATDAWSRIPNERCQWKEKKESRIEFRVACRKMNGGDQCDLNLSPVQSGRLITELLAAMEIDRPIRQNTKRYSAYLERPRQCAQHRSPEIEDRVQGRLRSTLELIQDYLIRAGRRHYNPGPGLFRKVLESDIRDPKEERELTQDSGLSNSEQRVGDRVFQEGWNNRYSGNNNAQRLGYNNRPASSLPTYQSSRRDATVSMLQLQGSLLQLQRNAVWSSTASRSFTKCLQSIIAEAMKRYSSRIFVYVDEILILNQVPTIVQREILQIMKILEEFGWMIAMDKSQINLTQTVEFLGWQWNMRTMTMQTTISRRRGVLKQLRHLMELAMRKKHEKTRNLASVIGEIQYTRAQFKRGALHTKQLQKLKDKEVASRGWNKWTQLNRSAIPDITWWINKLAHNLSLCFTRPNKWITIQTDASSSGLGATLTRENKEKVFAHGEQKNSNLKSSNQREVTAVLKTFLEFRQELIQQQPIGIQLLTDNTVTMYCLNKGKGSITIATLVDKILKLAEQYNWIIEASHITGLSNTIPDSLSRLSRCGDHAIKREIFQKKLKELGIQIPIVVFATRVNRQCTRYCSISKDKFAVKRNGFKQEWSEEVPSLHPPISQLLKTIRKVKKE